MQSLYGNVSMYTSPFGLMILNLCRILSSTLELSSSFQDIDCTSFRVGHVRIYFLEGVSLSQTKQKNETQPCAKTIHTKEVKVVSSLTKKAMGRMEMPQRPNVVHGVMRQAERAACLLEKRNDDGSNVRMCSISALRHAFRAAFDSR